MPTELATSDFLGLLERSELIAPDVLKQATSQLKLAQIETPQQAARLLVKNRLITPFQAERLLAGRARGFYIDYYKVLEILGVGGMGCIYVAEDVKTHRRVALKVLTTRHEMDSGMRARFQLEARAGLKLKHPNVCQTLHTGDTGAITYMALEYVKGISLHELIALGGPVKWDQACDMFMQAAAGLHHSHQSGLVHRDVKPANFLVDREGQVKILDFGLALLKDDEDAEFSLQMIFGHDCLGTADYIAPEQTINSSQVDCRADVYSLGCTMYLTLTGKFPFAYKHTAQKLEAHRTKQAKPISELKPDVPPEVVKIVERMMEKDPAKRFKNCAEVEAALAPFARRDSVQFDFQKILSMRIADMRLREQALHIGQTTTTGVSVTRQSDVSRERLQADIETVVAEDTSPARTPARSTMPSVSSAQLAAEKIAQSSFTGIDAAAGEYSRMLVDLENGHPIPLAGSSRLVLGRDATCAICIPDDQVSGKHCELIPEGDEWAVKDLGSKNGIAINGVRVARHRLSPGDRLLVGKRRQFLYREHRPERGSMGKMWAIIAASVAGLAGLAGLIWWLTR